MKSILFVGGGSIGHIAPSVAVMQQVRKMRPDVTCHFVCLPSNMETDYLRRERCAYTTIDSSRPSLAFPWKFLRAYRQATRLLSTLKPTVIFSKGGHLSVPVCLAARRRNIPIVLHESDAVSGYGSRMVGRWADRICTGFPLRNNPEKHTFTGNPVRQEIMEGDREEGLRITGLRGDRPVLLAMGGSQGAQALNEVIARHIVELLDVCDVIHITGRNKPGAIVADRRYVRREFVYGELAHFYAMADLALSRAGANTLSELVANAIPAIVVPLRGVGHDHQQNNAEAAALGGCILLDQHDLDNTLVKTVKDCLQRRNNPPAVSGTPARDTAIRASRQIAEILSEFLD